MGPSCVIMTGWWLHIIIAMSLYIFLSYEQRCHDDPRTLGTPFFTCCGEMRDLNLREALERLLNFPIEKVRMASIAAEDVVLLLVGTIMSAQLV